MNPRLRPASNCPSSTAIIPERTISATYAPEFRPNAIAATATLLIFTDAKITNTLKYRNPILSPENVLKVINKYVITLDADTELPMDTAKKLIGIMEHPLNQPIIEKITMDD